MTSLIRYSFAGLLVASLATAAVAEQRGRRVQPAPQPDLHAPIMNASGREVGIAEVGHDSEGLMVAVDINGLPPGRYAVHLHAVGRCDAPTFESAGPHWNPTRTHHGIEGPDGGHLGDLPNLAINANGRGFYRFTIGNAMTAGRGNAIMDADGAAIVIHAGEDDYRTDPAGNSGGRIACGVLRESG